MRVITMLPQVNWNKIGPAAKAAEDVGYDGVSVAETAHDLFMPLALATLATSKVELSTGIALAFPRSPMILAQQAWDVHAQSGGRFSLGLGSQIKAHNVRRFSVPWSAPVPRLQEYIESLRAIWACWERGDAKLNYEGEHYNFSLMTPEFSPRPTGLPMVPVSIAAVGPAMMRLAGRVCDGVRLHPFTTRRYIDEVSVVEVGKGLEARGRSRENIEFIGGGFVATGADEEEVAKGMDLVRYRVSFYGSTPAYRPVLTLHGLDDLGDKLHAMSRAGQWDKMAAEVPDDVVHLFAAVGTYDVIAKKLEERLGGIADSFQMEFPAGADPDIQRGIVQDLQRIEAPFKEYKVVA